jgi:hypothetical protein
MKKYSILGEYLRDYSANSTKNQDIKGQLVAREVNSCVTSITEWVLSKEFEVSDPFYSFDDITNFYSYPEFSDVHGNYFEGGTEDGRTERIEEARAEIEALEERMSEADENEDMDLYNDLYAKQSSIEDFISELEDLETEPAEIFEWWDVSGWFANRLEAYGECILDGGIWGRCTTGQAILLDHVITKIAFDMGILEGQENSWERN